MMAAGGFGGGEGVHARVRADSSLCGDSADDEYESSRASAPRVARTILNANSGGTMWCGVTARNCLRANLT